MNEPSEREDTFPAGLKRTFPLTGAAFMGTGLVIGVGLFKVSSQKNCNFKSLFQAEPTAPDRVQRARVSRPQ